MNESGPSFDEWVEYCFTQGYADFHNSNEAELESVWARGERFSMSPVGVTQYMTRLFEAPAFIAEQYSDQHIRDATWFLFGVGSDYCHDARSQEVPPDAQVRWMRSVATLYTDLYDQVCGERGSLPFANLSSELDTAVYMIWDMDCIEGAVMFPEKAPHLVNPGFEVLQTVLASCRMGACLQSALHGLGHIAVFHPARVQDIVDQFLAARGPELPSWLRDYAMDARVGRVH
jgi:hypothetical protein